MNNREARKLDFLRRPRSHQIGELAVALATFASFTTQQPDRPDITQQLLNEPICYAEWLVPEVNTQLKAEIAAIHTSLQEWQRDWFQINANEIAQVVEEAGASALTVHGRTAADYFTGSADWDRISEIKPYLKKITLSTTMGPGVRLDTAGL